MLGASLAMTATAAFQLGENLTTIYTKNFPQPVTVEEASAQGWKARVSQCDPDLGIPYTQGGEDARATPMTIYFTSGGQISGIGTDVYDKVEARLLTEQYYTEVSTKRWHIAVAFRPPEQMCSGQTYPAKVGDRVVVSPKGAKRVIPWEESGAKAEGYHRGSCFDGMGWHYFLDLETAPTMSWRSANLMPIVPMYNLDGQFHAFFFASSKKQQGLINPRGWEPIFLITPLMCKNTCDKDCVFKGAYGFSTMHIYFNDYTAQNVQCPATTQCSPPGIGCCESESAEKIQGSSSGEDSKVLVDQNGAQSRQLLSLAPISLVVLSMSLAIVGVY